MHDAGSLSSPDASRPFVHTAAARSHRLYRTGGHLTPCADEYAFIEYVWQADHLNETKFAKVRRALRCGAMLMIAPLQKERRQYDCDEPVPHQRLFCIGPCLTSLRRTTVNRGFPGPPSAPSSRPRNAAPIASACTPVAASRPPGALSARQRARSSVARSLSAPDTFPTAASRSVPLACASRSEGRGSFARAESRRLRPHYAPAMGGAARNAATSRR
jgi:hypothetical protein